MAKERTKAKDPRKQRLDEEREEFRRLAETHDPKLREKIITDHLYIAEILAKKYVNRGIEYDDLLQVASLGLIFAVDRYDVSKGFAFSSFATPTIVGELKRHFRDKGWVIRVPRRIQELSKKVNLVRLTLAQEQQRQPTVDEVAERLGVSAEDVLEEISLGDLIGVEDERFNQIDFNDVVDRLTQTLNHLEKRIFVYRYYDKRTQISIAEDLKISQMTVSRIEKKIIKKFRQELQIKPQDLKRKR